jgi:dynein heavy chain
VQLLKSFEELNYEVVPVLMTKILQLFETFSVRFGVMLVGFTCSAKSTAFRILQHAMTALRKNGSENKMFQKIHTYILNPKAISMGELYGEVNSFT